MRSRRESVQAWLFLAPATLHLAIFAVFPVLCVVVLAFYDWRILREGVPFVGMEQFGRVFGDSRFWNALGNSLRYALLSVPLGMAAALGTALLVARPMRAMAFFRTLYYVPAVTSGVATAMLWIYVYLPESGFINTVLKALGSRGVDFLNDPTWAMPAIAFMSVWTGLGPRMIVYVAGLLAIPPALGEAAALDGAGPWRRFCSITLPQLAPTSLFVLVTSTIASFQLFTPIYLMTKGGPLDSTDVVGFHIYSTAWQRFHISTASAQTCVLLVVIALVAAVQFRLMRDQIRGSVG